MEENKGSILINDGQSGVFSKIIYFIYYTLIIGFFIFLFFLIIVLLTGRLEALGLLFFPLLFFAFQLFAPLIVSIVVYRDAKKLKDQGANIESPLLWSVATFFTIGLPMYLAFRKVDYKKQVESKRVQDSL